MAIQEQNPAVDTTAPAEATVVAPVPQPPEKRFTFGKLIKNVLLISAITLAAMVAFYALAPATTALAVTTFLSGLPIVGPVLGGFAYAANFLIGFAGTLGGTILSHLGITGASHAATTAVGTTAVVGTGIVATGAAVMHGPSTTAVAATPPVPDPGSLVHGGEAGTLAAQSHMTATAAKIGHHAAEHEVKPRADWAQRVNASVAYHRTLSQGGSFADAVRAAHDTVLTRVNPRNASFSQQVNADRAALEAALAEPKR